MKGLAMNQITPEFSTGTVCRERMSDMLHTNYLQSSCTHRAIHAVRRETTAQPLDALRLAVFAQNGNLQDLVDSLTLNAEKIKTRHTTNTHPVSVGIGAEGARASVLRARLAPHAIVGPCVLVAVGVQDRHNVELCALKYEVQTQNHQ